MSEKKKIRQSNYEMLRLFAMFSIVFYHLLGVYWHNDSAQSHTILVALTSPFHIGVPVFVMISGYFGIRASWKGVMKLLVPVMVYYVPIALLSNYYNNGDVKDYIHSLMFLSQTEYWFIQTYLWLFLVSPAVNAFIHDIDFKKRLYIFSILAFITIYVGNFGNDPSLYEGKNVLHFILLYILGDTLRVYKDTWNKISWKTLLITYLLLNIGLVLIYPIKPFIPMNIFFPYNSVGIIINSILLMMLFGKMRFHSSFINFIAASSLVIYIIHGQPTLFQWQMNIVSSLFDSFGISFVFFITLIGFVLAIMFFSVAVDKLLNPLYRRIYS